MANTDYRTATEYISEQPAHARPLLRRVRAILRKALPGAEERISYQIPAYRLPSGMVLFFAGWREHYSLYPATKRVVTELKADLLPYAVSKGTIRFPFDQPVPARLIARIAKIRAAESEERARAKTESKSKTKRESKSKTKRKAKAKVAAKRAR